MFTHAHTDTRAKVKTHVKRDEWGEGKEEGGGTRELRGCSGFTTEHSAIVGCEACALLLHIADICSTEQQATALISALPHGISPEKIEEKWKAHAFVQINKRKSRSSTEQKNETWTMLAVCWENRLDQRRPRIAAHSSREREEIKRERERMTARVGNLQVFLLFCFMYF